MIVKLHNQTTPGGAGYRDDGGRLLGFFAS